MAKVAKKNKLKVDSNSNYGTGKRKSAIAKVWIFKGNGCAIINGLDAEEYLKSDVLLQVAKKPLELVGLSKKYDVVVKVTGGGLVGQSDAISLGVTRALLDLDTSFRPALKENGLITRDSRVKERKKYGRKKARKGYQFRKR